MPRDLLQEFLFVKFFEGVSKKDNKPFSILELSNGLNSFNCNVEAEDIKARLREMAERDQFLGICHVEVNYRGIQPKLVYIAE